MCHRSRVEIRLYLTGTSLKNKYSEVSCKWPPGISKSDLNPTRIYSESNFNQCLLGEVGAILIVCVSNLRNHRDQSVEENKLMTQLYPSLLNNMDPNKYFSGHNLKNTGRNRSLDMSENIQYG